MKYTKKTEKTEVILNIKLTKEEWDDAVKQAYEKEKGKYKIQGFRPGKAPQKVIEQNYGAGVFFDEALNIATRKYYIEILDKEKDIDPIDTPSLEIKKFDDKGIEICLTIPVNPEVELGQYKGLEVKKTKVKVTEAEVNDELKKVQENSARIVAVTDRATKNGDIAVIDFLGTIDGVAFKGGSAENYELTLGSHSFIDNFEEQCEGMNIGEEKDINVTFPENYGSKELAGKPAVFHIKLNAIKVKELPEINDELASNVSEFDTLEEYKKDIKKTIKESKERSAEYEVEDKLVNMIVESSKVEISETLIEQQIDRIMHDIDARLQYQGINLETYAKITNTKIEDLRKEQRETAEKSIKTRLCLEAIIKAEKIDVTEEEIDKKVIEKAMVMGKTKEEFIKDGNQNVMNQIVNELVVDKLMKFLKDNNTIQ